MTVQRGVEAQLFLKCACLWQFSVYLGAESGSNKLIRLFWNYACCASHGILNLFNSRHATRFDSAANGIAGPQLEKPALVRRLPFVTAACCSERVHDDEGVDTGLQITMTSLYSRFLWLVVDGKVMA